MGHKIEVIGAWTLLSWFAITLTAADLLKSSRVHRDQEES